MSLLNSWLKDIGWGKSFLPIHSTTLITACILIFYIASAETQNDMALLMPVTNETKWYTFLTCQLVHINTSHLWNNIGILATLGAIFEIIHGPIPSITVFWISGTTGILFEAGWKETPTTLSGASGGAFSMISAYFAHLLLNWKETPLKKTWFVAFVSCSIVTIILTLLPSNAGYTVAHLTHAGGFSQGILVGSLAVRNVKHKPIESPIKIVSFILSSSLIASVWYRLVLRS